MFTRLGKLNSYHLAVSIIGAISYLAKSTLKLNMPILVLHGGKDCYIQTKAVTKFVKKSKCPDISLKIIADGYHEIYLDKEKEVLFSKMNEWIRSHLDGGRVSRGFKNFPFRTKLEYSRRFNRRRLRIAIVIYLIGILL